MAATKTSLRTLARRWQQLQAELDRLDRQLQALVTSTAPTLVALPGVGVETAGQLLVTTGDNPQRLRGEAAFAHLCGVAPIPASSGRTHRHRLNRGGDRHANNALGRIALVRMRCHPPTRAYVERRTKQGLSKLDIIRCLKRYIAREVYHHLTDPPAITPPACPQSEASAPATAQTRRSGTPACFAHVPHRRIAGRAGYRFRLLVALLVVAAVWGKLAQAPRPGLLADVSLGSALEEPVWPTPKEAAMAKPWRCRLRLHRWQRLRGANGQWYRECRGCGKERIDIYKEGPRPSL